MRLPAFMVRNFRLKALAVALAGVMWTGVAYASNPPDTRSVSIAVPQDPGSLAPYTLVHPIPPLSIRVSGTRQHLASFDPSDIIVTADYRAIRGIGLQTIPLSVVNDDRDVLLDNAPTSITAEVDRLGSRTVGVTVVISAQPPQGYVVDSSSASPSTVTVIGPEHELGNVEVRATVNLTGQQTNYQAEEKVTLVDSSGQPLTNFGVSIGGPVKGEVLVSIVVTPSLTSRASAVLPRVSGSPSPGHYLGGVSVNPATVVLDGPQTLLNNLDAVNTQVISLSGDSGTLSFSVRLLPPPGVTATPSSVTLTITIIALPQPPSPTPAPTPTPTPTP